MFMLRINNQKRGEIIPKSAQIAARTEDQVHMNSIINADLETGPNFVLSKIHQNVIGIKLLTSSRKATA